MLHAVNVSELGSICVEDSGDLLHDSLDANTCGP